jgi:hypothetical protein
MEIKDIIKEVKKDISKFQKQYSKGIVIIR